jgi:hypothetical protein
VIVASYGEDLARRHAADFRTIMQSAMYRRLFPATRIKPRSNRADEMRTTRGGGRKAVSLGGAVTGFGADVIIIDDLMKAQEALSPRKREEVREYFEQGSFDHLNLPAIAEIEQRLPLYQGRVYRRRIGDLLSPEREPPETLDTIREQIGSYAFSAQYLQNPVPDLCLLGSVSAEPGP